MTPGGRALLALCVGLPAAALVGRALARRTGVEADDASTAVAVERRRRLAWEHERAGAIAALPVELLTPAQALTNRYLADDQRLRGDWELAMSALLSAHERLSHKPRAEHAPVIETEST